MPADLADAQGVNVMVQGVQAIVMAVTYIPARSLWLPGVVLK